MAEQQQGVWAAYYSDQSGVNIFDTEIKALRFAVDHSMSVAFWPFGASLLEVIT